MSLLVQLLVLFIFFFCLALVYVIWVEAPRAAKLLREVRRQQRHQARITACQHEEHGDDAVHALNGEAKALMQSHDDDDDEDARFEVSHVTLEVECESGGGAGSRSGTAELLTLNSSTSSMNNIHDRPLMLIMPGNPGLVRFYQLFMLYLHRLSKGQIEFRCLSYVGHTSRSLNHGGVFDFPFQIRFCQQYITQVRQQHPKRKLFLAGHSVGARICLHLIEQLERDGAALPEHVFLLFPTVFDIARTPNGRIHVPVLRYLRRFTNTIIAPVATLPASLRRYILYRHIGLHPYEVDAAMGLTQPNTVRNAAEMAHGEMELITALQDDLVSRHLSRLRWIWGAHDDWAPLGHLAQLQQRFGDKLQVEIAPDEVAHAFVIGGTHIVAPMVYKHLKTML